MFSLKTDIAQHLGAGGTLIVPTRWRAQAVRLAHAAAQLRAGRRVWASPDVLTAGGWLRRENERAATAQSPRLLSAAEEWFLWRQCAGEITAQLPLVNGASLGDALQRSSRLAAEYGIELRPGPAGSEAQLLHAAQRAFTERCRTLEAVTADALLSAATSGPTGGMAITLRGFDPLPPRLASLVEQRMAQQGSAEREPAEPMAPAAPQVMRAADLFEELERIAAWCQELVAQHPQARLLVILPGAAGPRERLAALIRQALDPRGSLDSAGGAASLAGIESGEPLSRQPLIAHALTTLSLLGGEELEAVRFGAWLRAACWSAPPEGARARLDLQLREYRWTGVRLRELLGALMLQKHALRVFAQELHTRLVRASAALDAGAQTRASPRLWSERFRAALQAAGWPGAMAGEGAGQQALLGWHELLEAFGGLNASAGTLAREEALRLLTGLAGSHTFHPAPEDVTVTISPTLADPVVSYDGIWVAGLHADVLPQPVAPDPFLPLAAQQAAGLPAASAAARLAQARTLLAAWRAGTAQLVLSAAERAGDVELLPSPMLPTTTPAAPVHTVLWLPAALHREALLESLTDATGVAWNARQTLPLGTRSLDLQNSCPFRAYAELRLGSEQPDTPEPGVPASERGKLLHGALERLWRRLRGSVGLQRAYGAPLEALIAQSVEEAAAELLANIPEQGRRRRRSGEGQIDMFAAMPRMLVRECARARRVIAALCEEERARAPFTVQDVEHGVDFVLGRARARLRIDRVDLLEGGGRAVIDYKSGRFRTGAWQDERPTWPQLLAYQHALGAEVTALATAWVSTRACRFDGATRDARVFPRVRAVRAAPGATVADGWRTQRAAWGAVLERLTAGLLAGDATVDPKPGACTHCHVSNICRIAERAPEEADPPPEYEP